MRIGAEKIDLDTHPNLVLNREYAPFLAENGLLDFERLYHYEGGTVVKQIRERRITRLEFAHRKGTRVFFLKRHLAARPDVWAILRGWVSGRSLSPGRAEFETICEFRENGIPTVVPVAAGERKIGFFRYESFLVTQDVAPYISLENLIQDHPERLSGKKGHHRKHRILTAIARLARKMHDKGFNHRDFNATHVLISPEDKGGHFSLALFDLQRMDRRSWLRFKWAIKIMAELGYTLPEPLFDEEDRILLFKAYKGVTTLGNMDRLLFFWIKLKSRRIGRHTEKMMRRRRKTGKENTDSFPGTTEQNGI